MTTLKEKITNFKINAEDQKEVIKTGILIFRVVFERVDNVRVILALSGLKDEAEKIKQALVLIKQVITQLESMRAE